MAEQVLVIACGALARELVELRRRNRWEHIRIQCLPAELHNTPAEIPGAVADALARYREEYAQVFVAYADCGTGGRLDKVLDEFGIERLPGAHCYEFFAGSERFATLSDEEPGTYYLTDFLVRHFDRLVVRGLGLDRHPELKAQYFGNYRRLVYLAQTSSEQLASRARDHAAYLGLEFVLQYTGLEPVERILEEQTVAWRN